MVLLSLARLPAAQGKMQNGARLIGCAAWSPRDLLTTCPPVTTCSDDFSISFAGRRGRCCGCCGPGEMANVEDVGERFSSAMKALGWQSAVESGTLREELRAAC